MSETDPFVWAWDERGERWKVRQSVAERNGWDYEPVDE